MYPENWDTFSKTCLNHVRTIKGQGHVTFRGVDVFDHGAGRRIYILAGMARRKNDNRVILLHILGWLLYLSFSYGEDVFANEWDMEDIFLTVSLEFARISTFYIFYLLIWDRGFQMKRRWQFFLLIGLGIAVFIVLRFFIEEIVYPVTLGFDNYRNDLPFHFYLRDNTLRAFLPVVASLIVFIVDNRLYTEREQLSLKSELRGAELNFLRSQINPHFLFNTLSFMHTKAYAKDQELAEAIRKLSEILRYSIQNSGEEKRTIREEIELLRNFISIHEMRFENNCFVDFNTSKDFLEQKIEPLLLLPFVENAFKHGIFNDPKDPIKIDIEVKKGQMHFRLQNRINHSQKDPGSGIGVSNITRRLSLLYPGKSQFEERTENDHYITSLTLEI